MKYISLLLFLVFITPLAAQEQSQPIAVENGVSWELAAHRKKTISNINYKISLKISSLPNVPVSGTSEITFDLNDISQDLQIDFKEQKSNLKNIRVNSKRHVINHFNEHIVIARSLLKIGENKVKITFDAGEGALNRSPNFLYTLFVPDRMRTSLPSFDQPNL
ncbi:MAG: peptidase M1, partial [Kordiimonadaceae bacterium]|nr:peptidase M1 [Kordiimonadaceae bacterium]